MTQSPQTKPDSSLTIDTLIITVGTRQIGWQCDDDIVRCFGTDGDRNAPPHTDELYKHLGVERGDYESFNSRKQKTEYLPWRMRDLGQRYYKYAQENNSFHLVELLMDEAIIYEYAAKEMKQLILWGTDQPAESTSLFYRRDDTLWLVELMAKKIELLKQQHQWQLEVKVVTPEINARDRQGVERFLTTEILPSIVDRANQYTEDDEFVLAIENTGGVPAISESLAIFAAGLIRQFTVVNITPTLPDPQYVEQDGGKTALKSLEHQIISVGDYFWSVEKPKIISAWKRGDFNEARIWLTPHQHRYDGLIYQLATKLTLCNNGDHNTFIRYRIKSWFDTPNKSSLVSKQQYSDWIKLWKSVHPDKYLSAFIYESSFSIYLLLERGNYTNAFSLFAQTLERLLYRKYKDDKWLENGIIKIPEHKMKYKNNYTPDFIDLIDAWINVEGFSSQKRDDYKNVLDRVRLKRNKIVHEAISLKPEAILEVWKNSSIKDFKRLNTTNDKTAIYEGMKVIMNWIYPQKDMTLFEALYDWGLKTLKD